jgi:hypothetical protein
MYEAPGVWESVNAPSALRKVRQPRSTSYALLQRSVVNLEAQVMRMARYVPESNRPQALSWREKIQQI